MRCVKRYEIKIDNELVISRYISEKKPLLPFIFNTLLIPQYSREMAFFSDQFLRDVLFFAVGGVSTVAILKIWENRESVLREIRRRFDSNETREPVEHDERFD